ncbi:MAG: hypothetical protein KQH63_06935 [Desulfobulbaceae bacterium]|nr:hypothetical protein [Desulfobulbaceae bacterium]
MATEDKTKLKGKNAFDMFPDIMGNAPEAKKTVKKPPSSPNTSLDKKPEPVYAPVFPPEPPDSRLLLQGDEGAHGDISDAQIALVLMQEGENKIRVKEAFEELGYLVESSGTPREAIEKMKIINVTSVVLQPDFEAKGLADSTFHEHMKWLPMSQRRQIFYVLIGPQFHTLYDLEALVESANLVVNERDIGKLPVILRKGFQDYDNLFGPYIAFLEKYGKK